jgi:hypothetical protein
MELAAVQLQSAVALPQAVVALARFHWPLVWRAAVLEVPWRLALVRATAAVVVVLFCQLAVQLVLAVPVDNCRCRPVAAMPAVHWMYVQAQEAARPVAA